MFGCFRATPTACRGGLGANGLWGLWGLAFPLEVHSPQPLEALERHCTAHDTFAVVTLGRTSTKHSRHTISISLYTYKTTLRVIRRLGGFNVSHHWIHTLTYQWVHKQHHKRMYTLIKTADSTTGYVHAREAKEKFHPAPSCFILLHHHQYHDNDYDLC